MNNLTGEGTPPPALPADGDPFVRTFYPREVSWVKSPTGFRSRSHSGKLQVRSIAQAGLAWSEAYGVMRAGDELVVDWLNYVDYLWRESIKVSITHPHVMGAKTCVIQDLTVARAAPNEFYAGLTITFLEVV